MRQADAGYSAVFSFSADDWKLKKNDNFTELNRTKHSASKAGARVEFAAQDTQAGLVGVKEKAGGKADVFVDGQLRSYIDTSARATQSRNSLFSAYGLKPGPHTLRLVVASGTIMIDFAEAENLGADAKPAVSESLIKRGAR